jgi:hypothetical protein
MFTNHEQSNLKNSFDFPGGRVNRTGTSKTKQISIYPNPISIGSQIGLELYIGKCTKAFDNSPLRIIPEVT